MDLLLSHLVYPAVVDHTKLVGPYRIFRSTTVENPEFIDEGVYKIIVDVLSALFGDQVSNDLMATKLTSKLRNLRNVSTKQYLQMVAKLILKFGLGTTVPPADKGSPTSSAASPGTTAVATPRTPASAVTPRREDLWSC